MRALETQTWGEGETAVMVHGSISTGEECWEGQRPLGEEGFRLVVPNRRGYGGTPGEGGEDFLRDARDVAELLDDGAHLVGHSYGAVAALLAAAERPDAVLSLTVVEPPAFGVADREPEVAEAINAFNELWAQTDLDDRAFLEAFLRLVGAPAEEIPEEMLSRWTTMVGPLRAGRAPWDAEIPFELLRPAPFPKLVVSGGHSEMFDVVCDELTRRLGAERAEITGAGHEVQMVSEPFNEALVRVWRQASGQRSDATA